MKYLKIKYRLLVYFTSFTLCSGDIKKKKAMKMTSHFQSFFCFFFPVNQLIKKSCHILNS